MIGTALSYIRKQLDDHLRSVKNPETDDNMEDRVVFLEVDKLDPLTLPPRRITMLVVNMKEDRECWSGDRYQRRLSMVEGRKSEQHYPDIHLELAVLFIANFKDYATAWNQLSEVLIFFQEHPVFEGLPSGIDRLTHELCSQSFQEQNELWGALRTSLRPALLHRFRLITLRGRAMAEQAPPIPRDGIQTRVTRKDK